jgi:hypothetical protein
MSLTLISTDLARLNETAKRLDFPFVIVTEGK